MITTINPATEERLATYPTMNAEELAGVLEATQRAAAVWRKLSFEERTAPMRKVATLMREQKERHATLMSLEMGKPFSQALVEVEKSAWVCDFYADHAANYLTAEEHDLGDGVRGMVKFEPLGVIFGVMPWNFPFWQVFRFAAPTLMAGNGVVVKHSPNVTGSAIAIEELFREAGFPTNLYRTVHIALDEVDALSGFIIEHPAIQGISITGSTGAGRAVAAKAGKAIKPSVLELGGSDPYLVLDDADINRAVNLCAAARLLNSGQTCIAAKRFLVHHSVMAQFRELFLQRLQNAVMGDPFDQTVEIGPMARLDLRDQLHDQVMRSIAAGAELLCGGVIPDRAGFFYPPTLLAGVTKDMPAYSEEFFGPVVTLIEVADDAEAIHIANDTSFGLGAAVFSQNIERALRIADQLETGNCFINSGVKSDPRMPFGGIKESGYGRELAAYGIRAFVNIKTICV
uniref:Aldehyde dehydrogenase family protein n=1 Tax=Chlorobium chlorochromatii (strain CaD3) TaxID=340177 RepID=Q3ATS2_CHLCH